MNANFEIHFLRIKYFGSTCYFALKLTQKVIGYGNTLFLEQMKRNHFLIIINCLDLCHY